MKPETRKSLMTIVAIAAVSDDYTIGNQGKIPWHNSEDLKRFKELTSVPNSAVLMGRKTWESLPVVDGEKLPGRTKIVLTRTKRPHGKNTIFISDFHESTPDEFISLGIKTLYIIGGAEVYQKTYYFTDSLLLTRIPGKYDGDTKFPMESYKTLFKQVNIEYLEDGTLIQIFKRKPEESSYNGGFYSSAIWGNTILNNRDIARIVSY